MLVIAASTLTSSAPAEAASAIQFGRIQYDSPGTDRGSNASLNAEYVQLKNVGSRTINLYRWYVRDSAGYTYRFASNFYLPPGYTVTLHTGKATNTSSHRYWGLASYVWNNTGDQAHLRMPSGALADYCSWTSVGSGYRYC